MNPLKQLLQDIKDQYHRIIIINEEDADTYKKFCNDNKIQIINLSAKLSELTVNLPADEKTMEAWDKLKEWMSCQKDTILAFDNIDYLFSPEVGRIDPIKNFNYYSRDKQIIILFIKARKRNNLLIYSEEGNEDYIELDITNNEGFVLGWVTK
jgi:hypothetical protein